MSFATYYRILINRDPKPLKPRSKLKERGHVFTKGKRGFPEGYEKNLSGLNKESRIDPELQARLENDKKANRATISLILFLIIPLALGFVYICLQSFSTYLDRF